MSINNGTTLGVVNCTSSTVDTTSWDFTNNDITWTVNFTFAGIVVEDYGNCGEFIP